MVIGEEVFLYCLVIIVAKLSVAKHNSIIIIDVEFWRKNLLNIPQGQPTSILPMDSLTRMNWLWNVL